MVFELIAVDIDLSLTVPPRDQEIGRRKRSKGLAQVFRNQGCFEIPDSLYR